MRYVPSTSNEPSARRVGRGNWPWPHPTARLHAVSATDRQALAPVHRPVARGPSPGPAGLWLHASRPPEAISATANLGARRTRRDRISTVTTAQDSGTVPANVLRLMTLRHACVGLLLVAATACGGGPSGPSIPDCAYYHTGTLVFVNLAE